MGEAYPALVERRDFITELTSREEHRFRRTLASGEQMLDAAIDDLAAEYETGGYGRFKEAVAEAIVAELAPVRARLRELDDTDVARILQKGALDARTRAERFQQQVRDAVGLGRV